MLSFSKSSTYPYETTYEHKDTRVPLDLDSFESCAIIDISMATVDMHGVGVTQIPLYAALEISSGYGLTYSNRLHKHIIIIVRWFETGHVFVATTKMSHVMTWETLNWYNSYFQFKTGETEGNVFWVSFDEILSCNLS